MEALAGNRPRTPFRTARRSRSSPRPCAERPQVSADPETRQDQLRQPLRRPLGLKSSTWVSLLAPIDATELRTAAATRGDEAGRRERRCRTVHYLDPAGRRGRCRARSSWWPARRIESVRLLKLSAQARPGIRPAHQSERPARQILPHALLRRCERVMPGRYDKSLCVDSDWATDAAPPRTSSRANGLWAGGAIYNNTSVAVPADIAGPHHGARRISTPSGTAFVNARR